MEKEAREERGRADGSRAGEERTRTPASTAPADFSRALRAESGDAPRVLRRACELLVASRGYRWAWAALMGDGLKAVHVEQAGLGREFEGVADALFRGSLPRCAAWSISHCEALHARDPSRACEGCPLLDAHRGDRALTVRLNGEGAVLGTLTVSLPQGAADLEEERAFLERVSGAVVSVLAGRAEPPWPSADLYRLLFDAALDVVFTVDRNGYLMTANPAAARALGLEPGQLAGAHMREIFPAAVADRQLANLERVFASGEPLIAREDVTPTKEGDRWFNTTLTPLRDERGTVRAVMGICRDVTEYRTAADDGRRLEEQLRRSQRMEAIGRLAGGIAHDFNNLLTAILGYAELALQEAREGDRLHGHCFQIRRASERAAVLTRQLLAFSRKQVLEVTFCDLNAVVDEVKSMLARVIGEDIELVTALAPSLGRTRADRAQIEQVLLNLAVNARDAMPEGGTIVLETRDVVLGEDSPEARFGVRPGPYVTLSVADTGCGMDEETCAHIFEPFFTTKRGAAGTGLGLSLVYGIVKQHSGHIAVASAPGRGTTFTVYLPRAEGCGEADEPAPSRAPRLAGTETVLVVEDDDMVRRFVCEGLESFGYAVLEAPCAEDALARFEECEAGVDLLVTDIVLPRENGPALFDRLSERRPGLAVVYMSGYGQCAAAPGRAVLQKPFPLNELVEAVRTALD